jgi:hypothetical protein
MWQVVVEQRRVVPRVHLHGLDKQQLRALRTAQLRPPLGRKGRSRSLARSTKRLARQPLVRLWLQRVVVVEGRLAPQKNR